MTLKLIARCKKTGKQRKGNRQTEFYFIDFEGRGIEMAWDPIWEQIFQEKEWGKYPGEELIRFVASHFYKTEHRKNVKLLEVGCGTGANLWFMAREGFTVYGADGSPTGVDRTIERLNRECPGWNGEVLRIDLDKLPYEDDFFDAVIDNESICCNSFESSKRIYKELCRVTKSGGKLFSRTFATGCWGDGTGKAVGRNAWIVSEGPMLNKGYTRFTSESDLEELIPDFQIQEIELLTRTFHNRQKAIKEWIIHAQKPTR
jgi:SAM-dependent methyltransferase